MPSEAKNGTVPVRPHHELRKKLKAYDITGDVAAKIIGCSEATFSHMMMGRIPFNTKHIYKLLDALGLPPESIPQHFPPDGRSDAINKA